VKENTLDCSLVLFSSSLVQSSNILNQYLRIPDVLARVVKAKGVLQKNKLPAPLWMYGLAEKKNTAQRYLASFLVTLGLYDRFVRFHGVPDLLMGSSLAVSVATRTKTFERSMIKILMGMHHASQAMRIYKRKADWSARISQKSARFSLLSFSKSVNHKLILQSLKQEYPLVKGVLISTHPLQCDILPTTQTGLSFKSFIDMDLRLEWLQALLRRSQIQKHSIKPLIEDNFI